KAEDLRVFSSHSLDESIKALEELRNPVILIFCAGSPKHTTSFANKLVSTTALHRYPIVFVGNEISRHERLLESCIPVFTVLDQPCEPKEILSLLFDTMAATQGDIEETPDEAIEEDLGINKKPTSHDRTKTQVTYVRPKTLIREISFQPLTFSDRLIEQVKELRYEYPTLGGDAFVRGVRIEELHDLNILPQDSNASGKIQDMIFAAGEWGKEHLVRVASVNEKMIKNLHVSDEVGESAKKASFLYSESLIKDYELMRKDYTAYGRGDLRAVLGKKVQETSDKISNEISDDKACEIIRDIGRIMEGQECSDTQEGLLASSIVMSDLVDRACWGKGMWSPLRAYSLLKRIKRGDLKNIHPEALSRGLLLVTEAVNSDAALLLLPKIPGLYRDKLKEIRDCLKMPTSEQETTKHITELQPGMTIACPILAFDGTVLLPSGYTLDHDLIMRLWQLTAVKPLLLPKVIVVQHEMTEEEARKSFAQEFTSSAIAVMKYE
ncbi:MAG: hypothetical protein KDD53_03405, partial [Bdellovibrionales bacterium]|nr:hypothetical protein [Bdellovibrionales bacterium]